MSNKKNTRKNNKNNKSTTRRRKSMKGLMNGKVGAPSKPVNWPATPFTMVHLFNRNGGQCELSLRTKVNKAVAAGELVELKPKHQPRGGVGRPKSMFVMKANFDPATMEVAPVKVKPAVTVPVTNVQPAPAVEAPAVVSAVPAQPMTDAPEVTQGVTANPAPVNIEAARTYIENVVLPPAPSSPAPAIG